MNVTMRLQPKYFVAIQTGVKDIELRLNDEKRQQLQLGDIITFFKLPDQKETVVAEIVGLLRYPTFADLAEDFAPERMGDTDKTSIVQGMHKYYSPEDQARFGVVGIKLKLR